MILALLIIVAKKGNAFWLITLIKAGANVDVQDKYGDTPLMIAQKGNAIWLDLLRKAAADVIQFDDEYFFMLTLTRTKRSLKFVELYASKFIPFDLCCFTS